MLWRILEYFVRWFNLKLHIYVNEAAKLIKNTGKSQGGISILTEKDFICINFSIGGSREDVCLINVWAGTNITVQEMW